MKVIKKLAIPILMIVGIFGVFYYANYSKELGNQYKPSPKQEVLSSLKDAQSSNVPYVYIVYKDDCPVCRENERVIVSSFKNVDDVYYVDATTQKIGWFSSQFEDGTFENAKTPYLIMVNSSSVDEQSNKLKPLKAIRLYEKSDVEDVLSYLQQSSH